MGAMTAYIILVLDVVVIQRVDQSLDPLVEEALGFMRALPDEKVIDLAIHIRII